MKQEEGRDWNRKETGGEGRQEEEGIEGGRTQYDFRKTRRRGRQQRREKKEGGERRNRKTRETGIKGDGEVERQKYEGVERERQ